MMPNYELNIFLIFIIGLCVGSFLNVVIDRLPFGKTIIRDRSRCDHCGHVLSWQDLIPILSFFLLGQKCRYCKKKISWQYPFIEFLTGSLFVMTYFLISSRSQLSDFSYQISVIYYLIIISNLIAIFFTDLKYRIIPDQILIIMAISTFIYLITFERTQILDHLLAGFVLFLFFLSLVLITRGRGMGLGDVKYAAVSGFMLGIPYSIVSFYLSFLTGAFFCLILILAGKKTMKDTIPFGPFLVLGTVVSLFWGNILWQFFTKIIGL